VNIKRNASRAIDKANPLPCFMVCSNTSRFGLDTFNSKVLKSNGFSEGKFLSRDYQFNAPFKNFKNVKTETSR
jgi:hypothetical protein